MNRNEKLTKMAMMVALAMIFSYVESLIPTDVTEVEKRAFFDLVVHSTEQIREMIGADSLGYMEIDKLKDMVGDLGYCDACFTGNYPMRVPGKDISHAFESEE